MEATTAGADVPRNEAGAGDRANAGIGEKPGRGERAWRKRSPHFLSSCPKQWRP